MAKGGNKSAKQAPVKAKNNGVKFSKDGPDFKFLLRQLKDGNVAVSEGPGSVKKRFPHYFDKYTDTQFRSGWTKAKNLAGTAGKITLICSYKPKSTKVRISPTPPPCLTRLF